MTETAEAFKLFLFIVGLIIVCLLIGLTIYLMITEAIILGGNIMVIK